MKRAWLLSQVPGITIHALLRNVKTNISKLVQGSETQPLQAALTAATKHPLLMACTSAGTHT
jgi:hypothetical protein